MAGIAIIADKHISVGFRLAGVDAYPTESVEEARATLSRLVSEGKHDLIILTEKLSQELRREKEKIVSMGKARPVFAVIPDFKGPTGQRIKELHSLISESVGAELKFGG
ncbi:MAG: V-type ATP synthase subunit F [Candidatus Bathyarchaeia archaeon]